MSHFEVRNAIEEVKAGKNLHIHINSEFPLVREYVADQGYGLDTLVREKDSMVRCAVAEQGYGHDILLANGETNEKVLERIKK